MVQGGAKLKASKPNPKKNRPHHQNKKKQNKNISKGWKTYAAKGRKRAQASQETQTSKAINKKNEVIAAARAVGAGNTFSLKDIRETGKAEIKKQKDAQRKRESNSKMSERLQVQLDKLK